MPSQQLRADCGHQWRILNTGQFFNSPRIRAVKALAVPNLAAACTAPGKTELRRHFFVTDTRAPNFRCLRSCLPSRGDLA